MNRWRAAGAWVAVALALALGTLVLHGQAGLAWRWQAELAWAQPWRWITAAWVHGSALHETANLAGCALVAAWGVAARCRARAAAAWLLAWPLTHLALLAQPDLHFYGGLSGVLHAGVAVGAWQLIRTPAPRQGGAPVPRWVGLAVMAGLVIKVLLESPWAGPTRQVPGWDIAIAPLAHASGVLAGSLAAAVLRVRGT